MQRFEYRVVPAPRRGEKAKGARTVPERFAHALGCVMNEMAGGGWEYLRTDTLPCEERAGLTGSRTVFQTMLVFRRDIAAEATVVQPPDHVLPASGESDPEPAFRAALSPVLSAVPEAPPIPAPPMPASRTAPPPSGAPRIVMHGQGGASPEAGGSEARDVEDGDGAGTGRSGSADFLLRALRKDHAAE